MTISDFEDEDEFCPHCDNHYVLEAVEPEASLGVEGEDIRIDSRYVAVVSDEFDLGKFNWRVSWNDIQNTHTFLYSTHCSMIKDDRQKLKKGITSIYDVEVSDKLG